MRRFFAGILSLCLVLCLLPGTALAAEGSMDHFTPERDYDGRFADVSAADWYYDNVVMLYELGLTEGQAADRFGWNSNVTLAETLSFAARIYSAYHLGDPEAGAAAYAADADTWYAPYVAYLQAEGVVGTQFAGRYTENTTRGQMAWVLNQLLPARELPGVNAALVDDAVATRRFITDVTVDTPYRVEIFNLYDWGIASGSDEWGSFHPDTGITRCEFAAMLTRLVDPDLRITLTWDLTEFRTPTGTTWADLYPERGAVVTRYAVDDLAAMEANFLNMVCTGEDSLYYAGGSLSGAEMDTLMENYLSVSLKYPEMGGSYVGLQWDWTGRVQISFSNAAGADRDDALAAAIAVHDQLWESGKLTADMTDREKAWVLCQWICANCDYDWNFRETAFVADGVFNLGSAVCQGYSAAYDLLLRLEGIRCWAVYTDGHMWNVAVLDGKTVHIDTTWADQGYGVEKQYFAMTEEYAWSRAGL